MAPLSGARILLSAHCDDHCKILFGIIPSLIEDIQTLFPFIFVVYRVISRRRRSPVGIFFFFFTLGMRWSIAFQIQRAGARFPEQVFPLL